MNVKGLESKLAAQRELSEAEREQAMGIPNLRQQLHRAEAQDTLLASLPQPRVTTRTISRILTATTLAPAPNLSQRTWARRWAVAAALALAVALSSTGYATAASLPGDTLYPLKRDAEQVRIALTFNPASRSAYQLRLGARRLAEAHQLLARGSQGVELDFVGILQQEADGGWSVSGLPVTLESGVIVTSGMQVQVHGATEGKRIRVRIKSVNAPGDGAAGLSTPGTESNQDGSQHRYGQPTPEPTASSQLSNTATPAAPSQNTPTSSINNPGTMPTEQTQPSLQSTGADGFGEPQLGQTTTPQPRPKGGKH